MTKPGLSDNEQKINDGIMGILDDLVAEQGGIAQMVWIGVRAKVQVEVEKFLDGLQGKDDE